MPLNMQQLEVDIPDSIHLFLSSQQLIAHKAYLLTPQHSLHQLLLACFSASSHNHISSPTSTCIPPPNPHTSVKIKQSTTDKIQEMCRKEGINLAIMGKVLKREKSFDPLSLYVLVIDQFWYVLLNPRSIKKKVAQKKFESGCQQSIAQVIMPDNSLEIVCKRDDSIIQQKFCCMKEQQLEWPAHISRVKNVEPDDSFHKLKFQEQLMVVSLQNSALSDSLPSSIMPFPVDSLIQYEPSHTNKQINTTNKYFIPKKVNEQPTKHYQSEFQVTAVKTRQPSSHLFSDSARLQSQPRLQQHCTKNMSQTGRQKESTKKVERVFDSTSKINECQKILMSCGKTSNLRQNSLYKRQINIDSPSKRIRPTSSQFSPSRFPVTSFQPIPSLYSPRISRPSSPSFNSQRTLHQSPKREYVNRVNERVSYIKPSYERRDSYNYLPTMWKGEKENRNLKHYSNEYFEIYGQRPQPFHCIDRKNSLAEFQRSRMQSSHRQQSTSNLPFCQHSPSRKNASPLRHQMQGHHQLSYRFDNQRSEQIQPWYVGRQSKGWQMTNNYKHYKHTSRERSTTSLTKHKAY